MCDSDCCMKYKIRTIERLIYWKIFIHIEYRLQSTRSVYVYIHVYGVLVNTYQQTRERKKNNSHIDWMDNCCVAVFCGDGVVAVVPIRVQVFVVVTAVVVNAPHSHSVRYIYVPSVCICACALCIDISTEYISPRGLTVRYSESPLTLYEPIYYYYILGYLHEHENV